MSNVIKLDAAPRVYLLTFRAEKEYNLKAFFTGAKWYGFFASLLHGHVEDIAGVDVQHFAFAPLEKGGTNLLPNDRINIRVLLPQNYAKTFLEKLAAKNYPPPKNNVTNIMDYFSYESVLEVTPERDMMSNRVDALSDLARLKINFITPLRISAPQGEAKKYLHEGVRCQKYLDGDFFEKLPGLGLKQFLTHCYRRVVDLGLLTDSLHKDSLPFPEYDSISLVKNNLLWHDTYYDKSKRAYEENKANLFSGAPGELCFDWKPTPFWAEVLTLAQVYHVSKSKNFGYGYFELPDIPSTIHEKSQSIYSRLFSYKRLRKRVELMPERVQEKALLLRLSKRRVSELAADSNLFKPLYGGFRTKKDDGSTRLIVTPDPLSKLLLQELNRMLGNGLNDYFGDKGAFAYRSGSSPQRAAKELAKHKDSGDRWVFRADIKNFFGSISHELLRDKLSAIYSNDPVVEFIMTAVSAPVKVGGEDIVPDIGIPQGLPISPLLSNIVLEGFDRYCNREKFNLIRYSDDIVVPCRSRNRAERIGRLITTKLSELGFELHRDKGGVEELVDNYEFLGIDISRPNVFKSKKPAPSKENSDFEFASPFCLPVNKRTLYLGGKVKRARIERHEVVAFDTSGKKIKCCLLKDIRRVVAVGNIGISGGMIRRCLYDKVQVCFVDKMGRSLGGLDIEKVRPARLTRLQNELLLDKERCMLWAKELVKARLSNAARVLDRNRVKPDSSELRGIIASCGGARSLDELRGVEGQGSRIYWSKWQEMVAPFEFSGRNRRPPKDVINAILSLLFTVLYNRVTESITLAGLDPRQGFYHTQHGRHNALASDLMEEFRHLVEMTVLRLIGKKMLKPEEFPDGIVNSNGFKLPSKVFAKVVYEFEETLRSESMGNGEVKISYAEWLDESAADMRSSLILDQDRMPFYAV